MLNDLKRYIINYLSCKSGNIIVDDFISKQIGGDNMIEFVPYNQFKDIKYSSKVKAYMATWITGNIQGWNKNELNFTRSGSTQVFIKKFNNSENITLKELNEVKVKINLS